jgi:hypothetical protein
MGHSAPSSFVIGATGPPSIADDLPRIRQIVANVGSALRFPVGAPPSAPLDIPPKARRNPGPISTPIQVRSATR